MEFVSARPDVFAAITGVALVATGLVRFYQNSEGRVSGDIDLVDSTLVGLLQGLAVIPGYFAFRFYSFRAFYRDFSAEDAFRLSFLLSVPVILSQILESIFSQGSQSG